MTQSLPDSGAYYAARFAAFRADTDNAVVGALTARSEFAVDVTQRDAWLEQIAMLRSSLPAGNGALFLEFNVPRVGSRIDAVVLIGSAIVVLEFKIGEREFTVAGRNQVWDYALDLKNFHQASHTPPIIPILIASDASKATSRLLPPAHDGVYPPLMCNAACLGDAILEATQHGAGPAIDPTVWALAPYRPTPSIIQAAQALYANHTVEAIARHDAGAQNLAVTSTRVEQIIEDAKRLAHKAVIFVTGVPGAGKTLVGLNVATETRDNGATHAVFLSGNGPLVKVLREALARDEVARLRSRHTPKRKGEVLTAIKAFIQNVHHFRDAGLRDLAAPTDRVVIFDEAQRAWDQEMTANFMKRKKKHLSFGMSEPEFLLSCMDRHPDWAVVVCLVGGGQEINKGEAGISAWLDAVSSRFPGWTAYLSPNLTDSEYDADVALRRLNPERVRTDDALHLSVSMRSFRAEHVSRFVKLVLDLDMQGAGSLISTIQERYPIVLTRSLPQATQWVKAHARGSERFGLVASSGAQRLKPHAVDVRVPVDPVHWFLNGPEDTRSSYYLEDAATEFQVQGLEVDWACVTWDADLRFGRTGWNCHSFRANRWEAVRKRDRQNYLRNAYRVLLTRARQGMAIVVPEGDPDDHTRLPQFYDTTFDYLRNVGIPLL